MKLYYNDPEVYPATYNFRDEVDGTSGTDIGWITSIAATDTGYSAVITASEDGHRKIIKIVSNGDNGAYASFSHDTSGSPAGGTIELWAKYIDNGQGWLSFYFDDSVANNLTFMYFNSADNKFYVVHGDGVGGHETSVGVAAAADTWHHVKVIIDVVNDDVSVYLNDIVVITDEPFYDDREATDISDYRVLLQTGGGVNALEGDVDAFGESWDTSYAVGDNVFWRHYKESEADTFEEDDVGTQGTSITWVDAVDTAASVEIINEFNEHKKVIRVYYSSAAGGFDYASHTFATQAKTGWAEFWYKTDDITIDNYVRLEENGVSRIITFGVGNSVFEYEANGGAWTTVPSAPIPVNATRYHIYIQWYDAANDNFDLWIDNVQYLDGVQTFANQTTGIDRFIIDGYSATKYVYIDAPTSSLDGDSRGDNLILEDDWVELTTIKTYPVPRNRMDETSQISFTIDDFEGALYSKWFEHNFIGIKVLDDDDIVLFRGFLTGKKFTRNELICTARGLSAKLDWTPLKKDYVEAEGIVKTIPYAGTDVPSLYGTYIVPDATPTADWTHKTVSDLADTIDDSDDTYISAGDGDESKLEIYSFPACPAGVTTIEEITVTLRCRYYGVTKSIGVTVSEDNGVGWEAIQYVWPDNWFSNKSKTFTGLTLAAAAVNANLLVKIIANISFGAEDISRISEIDVEFSSFTGTSGYALELETTDEALLNWLPDRFVSDTDMGILIVDNTGNIDTETFEATANPTVTNGTYISGDKEGLDTKYDGLKYVFKDTITPHNAYITVPTGHAVGIADTQTLHKIEINYRIGVYRSWFLFGLTPPTKLTIKILDDDNYDNNAFVIFESNDSAGTTEWIEGTLTIEDSDTNLQKFLVNDAGDYKSLTGLRLYLEGWALNLPATVYVDLLDVTIYYAAVEVSPIMEQIDSNGAEYVLVDGRTWVSTELTVGDSFKIGPISTIILTDIFTTAVVNYQILSTLTHYIAQLYRGTYCKEVLKKICLLEGLHWWEDHPNNRVVIAKEADFVDSTEDLTQADYSHDWEFEDDNNYYSGVDVYGKASLEIYYRAYDSDIDSPMTKVIIEETITTLPEAQEVAEAQLLELKTKRPSIKIQLKGVFDNLRVGKTVGLTMVRPTVVEADYPIRMIERKRLGFSLIQTTIYCGLGHSILAEKIADTINKAMYLAHQAHTDRLTAK